MNLEQLRQRCLNDYGRSNGKRLFGVMKIIAEKGFCVSTGWTHNELSVSRGCRYRGTIFKIIKGYEGLIIPDGIGTIKNIEDVAYEDIIAYLPTLKFGENYRHCDCYEKYAPDPKEWLSRLGINYR